MADDPSPSVRPADRNGLENVEKKSAMAGDQHQLDEDEADGAQHGPDRRPAPPTTRAPQVLTLSPM
jgi:hypothetical protein